MNIMFTVIMKIGCIIDMLDIAQESENLMSNFNWKDTTH